MNTLWSPQPWSTLRSALRRMTPKQIRTVPWENQNAAQSFSGGRLLLLLPTVLLLLLV